MNAERSKATPEEENVSLSLSLSLASRQKKERGFPRAVDWTSVDGCSPVRQSRRFFVGRDPERLLGIMWVCFFWVRFFLFFFVKSQHI